MYYVCSHFCYLCFINKKCKNSDSKGGGGVLCQMSAPGYFKPLDNKVNIAFCWLAASEDSSISVIRPTNVELIGWGICINKFVNYKLLLLIINLLFHRSMNSSNNLDSTYNMSGDTMSR